MEELIKVMSDEDLAGLKAKYPDNPSVVNLIDGILATREKEAEQVKVKAAFEKEIGKLFAKLPHPDNIGRITAYWGGIEAEVGEPEPVIIDGETEMRTPKVKQYQWIVEINPVNRLTTSGTPSTPTASKRAIIVYKRNGTTLEPQGNFASASKACEKLGLTIGGDSATRVLARDGYISEPYEGTEYTPAQQRLADQLGV